MHLRSVVAAVIVLSASLAARADTLTENYTVTGLAIRNNSGAYGVTSTSFSQFDTSLGTLNSITIALSGNATSTSNDFASFFGVTAASQVNQLLLFGTGYSSAAGSFAISANGNFSNSFDLPMFEGSGTEALVLDFETDSGTVTADGVTGTLTYNYTPLAAPLAATPEPSSLVLLGTGILGMTGAMRRRFHIITRPIGNA